jgi:hypothetical protein
MKILKPPKHLKKHGRQAFETLQAPYGITDEAGVMICTKFAELADELADFDRQIAKEGSTFRDRFGGIKPHPLLAARRDTRSAQLQLLKALNLDLEPVQERPGRPLGGKIDD